MTETDFDISVDLLYQSFLTWYRLQHHGLVTKQRYDDIRYTDSWQHRYPPQFQLLHRGSRCPQSLLLGVGKYARVYQRGAFAYKIVKIATDAQRAHDLRCHIKEMCFFHSFTDPHLMKAIRSQMVMEHGKFKKFIHEMPKARCTLQEMIYTHEITCCQDLVYLLRGLAQGIQYLHRHHIIHGDLKPSNILISQRYEPQISDFTLTTVRDKGQDMAFGTLFWRSPECLLQESYGQPGDVWSFGIMILDCLYGCHFMQDIVRAKDNRDLLRKLHHLILPPNATWAAKVDPRVEDLDLLQRLDAAEVPMTLTEMEEGMARDLIQKILIWDPAERPTIDDVLQHPFFDHAAVNPLPVTSEDPVMLWDATPTYRLAPPKPTILRWRDRSEREFIERWIKYYYHEIFGKAMPSTEDWLLHDITVLSKRLIDHLKILEATFHVKRMIEACSRLMFFIWLGYWPEQEVMFECTVFHLLQLLQYRLFVMQIDEKYVHEQDEHKDDQVDSGIAFMVNHGQTITLSNNK